MADAPAPFPGIVGENAVFAVVLQLPVSPAVVIAKLEVPFHIEGRVRIIETVLPDQRARGTDVVQVGNVVRV